MAARTGDAAAAALAGWAAGEKARLVGGVPAAAHHPLLPGKGRGAAERAYMGLLIVLSEILEEVAKIVDAGSVVEAPSAVQVRGALKLRSRSCSISWTVLGAITTTAQTWRAMLHMSSIGRSRGFFFELTL